MAEHRSSSSPTPDRGGAARSASGDAVRILVDGHPQRSFPVEDRGLGYGDGLFETIRIRHGMPCLWEQHLERLGRGADRLGLPLPSAATLRDEATRSIAGLDDGLLKLIITRGVGGRGYRPPAPPQPRRILMSYALTEGDDVSAISGISARYCETPASVNPYLAGIKHLNRLDAVLARAEWSDPRIAEGLMREPGGSIVGGTMTNLFVWDGTELVTPPVNQSGIAGTVRAVVLEHAARLGMACVERPVRALEMDRATGLFLTNARIGVWPVRRLDGRVFDLDCLPYDLLTSVRQAALRPGWGA